MYTEELMFKRSFRSGKMTLSSYHFYRDVSKVRTLCLESQILLIHGRIFALTSEGAYVSGVYSISKCKPIGLVDE